jgi:glycosyltransferase involved in cell wall biosynthesis
MNPPESRRRRIATITPFRTDYYQEYNSLFEQTGRLRLSTCWQRQGYLNIPEERTHLLPACGAITRLADMCIPTEYAEPLRFSLYPAFDRWAASKLMPGDWVFSSYGYANKCFRKAKTQGGITFLDGGNSHPENFWKIVGEEHRKWGIRSPPIPEWHYRRSLAMMKDVDYVLAPSGFVANSFLERGFPTERILRMFYPVDLSRFRPKPGPRPSERPFTIINTGGLSLRKGAPYLLEAYRRIRETIPTARLLLTRTLNKPVEDLLKREYSDLPIEWAGYLGQEDLATRLREADLFILPSLEEGLARTAIQAMACGLPSILTAHTGANDYITDGVNGSIVPLCDSEAIASEAITWWNRIQDGYQVPVSDIESGLSIEAFHKRIHDIFTAIEAQHG